MVESGRSAAPLPSMAVVIFVVVGSKALAWPVLLFGEPFVFKDTASYLAQGEAVVRMLGRMASGLLGGASPSGVASGGQSVAALNQQADVMRSLPYGVFAYVSGLLPIDRLGIVFAQSALVLIMIWVLVAPAMAQRPWLAAAVSVTILVATPAAWYASFLTPDILVVALAAFVLILVTTIDDLPWTGIFVLVMIASFAVVSHYGNIPLAAASIAVAFALRLMRRRLQAMHIVIGVAPLLVAFVINTAIGIVATGGDKVTVAPLRLPILLARSIEDGPARWYLNDACPTERYAICTHFDDQIPDNIAGVLWGSDGLAAGGRELLDEIRDEEPTILWRSFLDYPVAQLWSLSENTTRQFFEVGVARLDKTVPPLLDYLMLAGYLASLALLGLAAARAWSSDPVIVDVAVLTLVVLVTNAAIFGGLSAPVDRYQGRLAWFVAVVAAYCWARIFIRSDASLTPSSTRNESANRQQQTLGSTRQGAT